MKQFGKTKMTFLQVSINAKSKFDPKILLHEYVTRMNVISYRKPTHFVPLIDFQLSPLKF